jgi:hypothetical protein
MFWNLKLLLLIRIVGNPDTGTVDNTEQLESNYFFEVCLDYS